MQKMKQQQKKLEILVINLLHKLLKRKIVSFFKIPSSSIYCFVIAYHACVLLSNIPSTFTSYYKNFFNEIQDVFNQQSITF